MSLAIEAAELMEHFQWLSPEESRSLADRAEKRAEVGEELADVLCYALALANELGLDVAEAVHNKIVKDSRKYPAEEFRGRYSGRKTRAAAKQQAAETIVPAACVAHRVECRPAVSDFCIPSSEFPRCSPYFANCSSITETTSSDSGLTLGAKRATTLPSRPIRNFSKFQLDVAGGKRLGLFRGQELVERALAFALDDDLREHVEFDAVVLSRNPEISSSLPGSCLPNSLAGKPRMAKPLSAYF